MSLIFSLLMKVTAPFTLKKAIKQCITIDKSIDGIMILPSNRISSCGEILTSTGRRIALFLDKQ